MPVLPILFAFLCLVSLSFGVGVGIYDALHK